ncbi:MAG: DUF4070 domain-containing protein, partial [Cyanobacteria bacterium J06576_12]
PGIRRQFWQQLLTILRIKPSMFNAYIGLCAAGEHFWEYRTVVKNKLSAQMGYDLINPPHKAEQQPTKEKAEEETAEKISISV